jgi:hypothetical protein
VKIFSQNSLISIKILNGFIFFYCATWAVKRESIKHIMLIHIMNRRKKLKWKFFRISEISYKCQVIDERNYKKSHTVQFQYFQYQTTGNFGIGLYSQSCAIQKHVASGHVHLLNDKNKL